MELGKPTAQVGNSFDKKFRPEFPGLHKTEFSFGVLPGIETIDSYHLIGHFTSVGKDAIV